MSNRKRKILGSTFCEKAQCFVTICFFHQKITPFPSTIYPPASSQICQWKSTSLHLLTLKTGGCFHVTIWLNRKIFNQKSSHFHLLKSTHQRGKFRCPSLPCHLDLHVVVTSGTAAVTRWPWTGAVGYHVVFVGFSLKNPSFSLRKLHHLLVCWFCWLFCSHFGCSFVPKIWSTNLRRWPWAGRVFLCA